MRRELILIFAVLLVLSAMRQVCAAGIPDNGIGGPVTVNEVFDIVENKQQKLEIRILQEKYDNLLKVNQLQEDRIMRLEANIKDLRDILQEAKRALGSNEVHPTAVLY